MTADMLDAALDYAARGWPLFPVNPKTNRPLLRSAHPEGDPLRHKCRGECGQLGHGFHDATTDADLVRAWWTRNPHAAIGARTGVAFDVLDVDLEHFEVGVADLPDCETVAPSARSGGGNWHAYFKPSGLGRSVKFNKSKTCDWLGTDGYVILPPSGHKSGGRYSWIVSPDEVELHDAPEVLVEAVKASRAPSKVPAARTVDPSDKPGRTSLGGWSPSGLLATMAAADEGERNDRLVWAAHRIGADVRRGKAKQAGALEALADLADVAETVGLGGLEVERTIASGYSAGVEGRGVTV